MLEATVLALGILPDDGEVDAVVRCGAPFHGLGQAHVSEQLEAQAQLLVQLHVTLAGRSAEGAWERSARHHGCQIRRHGTCAALPHVPFNPTRLRRSESIAASQMTGSSLPGAVVTNSC